MAKPNLYEINRDQQPDAANPHSRLVVVGHPRDESLAGWWVTTDSLQPYHGGFQPSPASFTRAKLTPAICDDAIPWTTIAYHRVVPLPPHAGNHLCNLRTLFETVEHEQPAAGKALPCYITLISTPERHRAA